MKKYGYIAVCIIALTIFIGSISHTLAVKATPTPKITPTPTSKDTPTDADILQTEKIKNLIASRVAELKLVDKEGILATVQDVNNTQITAVDDNQNPVTIDIDELTQFSDSANKTFGVSDIKKGDLLSFVGLYNKETKHLLARSITAMHTLPVFFEGVITDKDTKNFTYTAVDASGNQRILNIESSSKIYVFSNGDDTDSKSGFSKAEIGERVFAAGFNDLKDPKTLNVDRLTYFTDLPPSAAMMSHSDITTTPSEETSTTPTTRNTK